jgi:uncharacterized protein DUF3300
MKTTSFRLSIMAQVLPFLLIAPALAPAQTAPTRTQATAALNPANPAAARYTRQQIDQMAAPVALYPDQLLGQVLMAATYPQQIVEAAEWLKDPNNAQLKGDALVAALQPLPWDPSVKSLVAFPQIVAMMSDHIEWTEALGIAFTTQQAEVMARVQALRRLAVKSGRLDKLRHLAVRQEGPVIVIAPAEPDRIFVPVYNPVVVYGEWPDRDFPPVFLMPSPNFVAETIEPGIEFSTGFAVVAPLWGWSRPDWRANRITVDRVGFSRITRNVQAPPNNVWRHFGPVVLVSPGAVSRTGAAAAVPPGTVAPTAAAAVVSLPQRAAAQPTLIQSRTTPTPPGAAQPGQAQTTPTQPGTVRPGQAQTTPTQPGTVRPGQAQTTPTQPGEVRPGHAQTTTGQPAVARPGQAQTAPTRPAGSEGTTSEPGKPQAKTTHPGAGEPATPPRAGTEPGPGQSSTATQSSKPLAAPTEPTERQPGQSQATPTRPDRVPGAATGSAAREPGAALSAPKPAEPIAPAFPGQAGAKPPVGAQAPMQRGPEHAGSRPSVAPDATPQGAAAQRPAPAPEGARQGSSAPPAHATPPAAQQPRDPAGARPPGREEGNSRER